MFETKHVYRCSLDSAQSDSCAVRTAGEDSACASGDNSNSAKFMCTSAHFVLTCVSD
jgi:hypothetical protein